MVGLTGPSHDDHQGESRKERERGRREGCDPETPGDPDDPMPQLLAAHKNPGACG